MELSNAVVVVTGGSRGIGKAIAAAFCDAGASVVITSRSQQQVDQAVNELHARGGKILGICADITDQEQIDHLVSSVTATCGPIDILVNNAGSYTAMGPSWEVDPADWLHDVRTNMYGTFLCCRAVIPSMLQRRQGYIIIMTGGGANGPMAYASGYGSSKLALVGFAESLAMELHDYGISVFVTDPGFVQTDMTRGIANNVNGQRYIPFVSTMFAENKGNPPELCAQLVLKLVSGQVDALSGRYFYAGDDFAAIVAGQEAIRQQGLLHSRIPPLYCDTGAVVDQEPHNT